MVIENEVDEIGNVICPKCKPVNITECQQCQFWGGNRGYQMVNMPKYVLCRLVEA